MDVNPIELKEQAEEAARSQLNALVAVTVALLASFMGVCKIKDDNICQAMQKDQTDRIDAWGYYQAKNTQAKVLSSMAESLSIQADALNGAAKERAKASAAKMLAKAKDEESKKDEYGKKADAAEKDYDALNYRDDQFDLSDALLALSITLLAITSLTQKRWLYWVSLAPTSLGILMGLAGILQWKIHPDAITTLLSFVGPYWNEGGR